MPDNTDTNAGSGNTPVVTDPKAEGHKVELTPEEKLAIAREVLTNEGIPEDVPVKYKYQGQEITEPWDVARNRITSNRNTDSVYNTKMEEVKAERKKMLQEIEDQKKLLEAKEEYYRRVQAQLLGGQPQDNNGQNDIPPEIKTLATELSVDPQKLVESIRKYGGFPTKDEIDKLAAEKAKPALDQVAALANELTGLRNSIQGEKLLQTVYTKYPHLNPANEVHQKYPKIYSRQARDVYEAILSLGDPKSAYAQKYGDNIDMLLKDMDKDFQVELESIKVADRESQREINATTPPHNTESVLADLKAGENISSIHDAFEAYREAAGIRKI
jgi:hypothetical protein